MSKLQIYLGLCQCLLAGTFLCMSPAISASSPPSACLHLAVLSVVASAWLAMMELTMSMMGSAYIHINVYCPAFVMAIAYAGGRSCYRLVCSHVMESTLRV